MNGSGIALSTDCRKQIKKNLMILSLDEDYSENEQRGHSSRVFKTKLIVQQYRICGRADVPNRNMIMIMNMILLRVRQSVKYHVSYSLLFGHSVGQSVSQRAVFQINRSCATLISCRLQRLPQTSEYSTPFKINQHVLNLYYVFDEKYLTYGISGRG